MSRSSAVIRSLVVVILGSCACAVLAPPDVFADGRLRVSPSRLDFGERGQMERPNSTLTLFNDGDKSLEVLEIKPSCSCIQVSPKQLPQPIPPGGSVELRVSMSSGRAIGRLSKYIAIRTTGTKPLTRVTSKISVFYGLRQEPRDVHFEGIAGGDPVARSVDFLWPTRFARGGAGFSLEVVEVTSSYRLAGLPPKLDALFSHRIEDLPGGKRLHLSVLPEYPKGKIFATIRLLLDGKTLEIPLRGELFRGILISPTSLNFNRVYPNDADSFVEETRFVSADGRPFSITGTKVSISTRTKIPGLDLEISSEPNEARTEWTLRARIRIAGPALPRGSFSGKLFVETDHPEKPHVELGFFGFFRASNSPSGVRPPLPNPPSRR